MSSSEIYSQDHLSPTQSSAIIIYVMSGSSDWSLAARLNRYLMLIMNERHTQTHRELQLYTHQRGGTKPGRWGSNMQDLNP